jgi:cbb3-type cytochrome oxidase maturation protein
MEETPTAAPKPWGDYADLGLFTDLYELTMLQAYVERGMDETATFSLFVRRLPERRNYLLACGLDDVLNPPDRRTVHVGLVARRCRQRAPARLEARMSVLIYLVPIALALGALGLAAYLWALRSGQFDDLDGAAERILFDDD